ncbi:MAG: 30S ribosomal protein S6e [archaeon]
MAEFKLVINDPKTGKSYTREVKEDQAKPFLTLKIGNKVSGKDAGFVGYEFEITGGSDSAGFPMRRDVDGVNKKRILAVEGVGLKRAGRGVRQRKTVAGNTVYSKTAQINLKILKAGKDKLDAEAAPAEGDKPAADVAAPKVEEKKAEDKPAEDKEEEPKADKPKVEEKPAEEKKPEPKAEKKPAEDKKEEPKAEEKK